MKPGCLIISRFELAMECPTKLYHDAARYQAIAYIFAYITRDEIN